MDRRLMLCCVARVAEENLATALKQKVLAKAYDGCGEPKLNNKPNTNQILRGKPNVRCGKLWSRTKHTQNAGIFIDGYEAMYIYYLSY